MTPTSAANSQTQWLVLLLGASGLLPFVAPVFILVFFADIPAAPIHSALLTYGAVILSFLGGIQWGLATVRSKKSTPETTISLQFIISVIPSLLGWAAVLIPTRIGYFVLALSFAAVLAFELATNRWRDVPDWYVRLRTGLTLVVVPCLLAGGILYRDA